MTTDNGPRDHGLLINAKGCQRAVARTPDNESVELECNFDCPSEFLHLWRRKGAQFSDDDGPFDDGDPFRLDHGGCLEPCSGELRILGGQDDPGFPGGLCRAGENANNG